MGAVLLSVGIEAAQYVMNTGRVVDVDDVVRNSLGGMVGVLFMAGGSALAKSGR